MNTWPLKLCGLALALGLSPGFWAPLCQAAGPPTTANEDSPNQDKLLLAARQYAARYLATLPSFICTQTTYQFEAGKKAIHWHKGDSLTSQLIWDQGREQRTLQLVNNRPVSDTTFWRSPLVSEGEFGNLLDSVLGDSSSAVFAYRGHEVINQKRVGIFEYEVDRAHSPMKLSLGGAQAVVAFRGFIYADENDGTVWRITNNSSDFPPELRTKSISRSVDYDQVVIGTTCYVLPVHAAIILDTGSRNIKNELKFDNYRKFGADSHITFSSDDLSKTANGDPIKR